MRRAFRSPRRQPGSVSPDRRAPACIAREDHPAGSLQECDEWPLRYPLGASRRCCSVHSTAPQSPVPHSKSRPIALGPVDAYAQLILDSVPHVVWTASADGATTSLNRRGMAYTGAAWVYRGRRWLSRAHPDDRELAREAWAEAVATGTDYAVEYRFRRFDGVYRWHSFRAEPVRGSDGKVAFWIGTATDIDDQRNLELSLRKSEKEAVQALTLLESIGDAAPVGFKLVDRDLRIVRINKRLADVDGRTVSEQRRTHCRRSGSGFVARTRRCVPPGAGGRARVQHRAEPHQRGQAEAGLPLSG